MVVWPWWHPQRPSGSARSTPQIIQSWWMTMTWYWNPFGDLGPIFGSPHISIHRIVVLVGCGSKHTPDSSAHNIVAIFTLRDSWFQAPFRSMSTGLCMEWSWAISINVYGIIVGHVQKGEECWRWTITWITCRAWRRSLLSQKPSGSLQPSKDRNNKNPKLSVCYSKKV